METKLLTAIADSETRLLAAIRASDEKHEGVHREMRRVGDHRHSRIDDWLAAEQAEDAVNSGRKLERSTIIAVLRYANEFRWLLFPLIAGAWLLSGGQLSLGERP